MTQKIYLDNNGTTDLAPQVRDLLNSLLMTNLGNPSSTHSFGQKTRSMINRARDSISHYLGIKSTELIFNSGGTESANMVLRGRFASNKPGHLITSAAEHSCVYATAKYLETTGTSVTFLSPGLWGAVTPESVRSAIRSETQLIALMAVNNETGVKTDIQAIAAIAKENGIPLFVDGVALLGKEAFTIPDGVSAMSFSGHKIHAPSGVGMCFVRSGFKLSPQITGGEQELGKRAGTENVLGILALAKAVELLVDELPHSSEKMLTLRKQFEEGLLSQLPNAQINGLGPRTVNISNIAFPGVDGEGLLIALDAAGVAASHGSACSSGSLEPSRILLNMGIPLELVRSSIRFSLSRYTTEEEIVAAIHIVVKTVNRLQDRESR